MDTRQRYRGCFLAMACGDALGAAIEFMAPEVIEEKFGIVRDFHGGGPFNWPVGAHTDDTEMALRLGESLIDHPEVDLVDITTRWLEWLAGNPPDVGALTRDGLIRAQAHIQRAESPVLGGKAAWEASGCEAAGNGSLMRAAPVAMLLANDRERMIRAAADISAITHYDPRCQAACIVFCLALREFFRAGEKRGFLDLKELADAVEGISPETAQAVLHVFDQEADEVSTTGYVINTLQAALWPCDRAMGLEDGIISIVNLGYDADTCGAVAGALLGARDGDQVIPERWTQQLLDFDRICLVADRLHDIAVAG